MELKLNYFEKGQYVFPRDWTVSNLSTLCSSIVDGTHFTPKYVALGIPFYSVESVTRDDFMHTKFISEEEHSRLIKRCKPERGDILLTRIGSLGETKFIDWDVNASIYVSLALLKFNDKTLAEYVYWYTKSPDFVRDVEKLGLLNATPKKINMGDIGNVPIPLPTLIEQRAIAAAISDSDALLSSLDRLLDKKRDIKQAVMQQLLTGKQRLPGFRGEWKSEKIGRLFQFLSTGNNPRSDLSLFGDVGYVHYGDIHTKEEAFLDCANAVLPQIAYKKVSNLPLLQDGDLVMADASEDYAGVGKSVEIKNVGNRKIVAGLHTFLLRGDKELIIDGYKGYLQSLLSVKDAMTRYATGISVYGISKTNIRSIEIYLPSREEQTAIAAVLSDLDAEIDALQRRRNKTRVIKQGMMQELLTGRTRLI